MSLVFIGVLIGMSLALSLRTLLDWYVESYKRKHGQWPYDRTETP